VILRWGDREQNPPDREILAAALVAAEYSDARFSGLVPVDWTRRKYVRKPRKSAPGSVIPDRIRTIFVEPDPARVRAMVEAGPDAP
jgi:predicted ribosome quality control (RQC) complex YloA/Tae2 family protein